MSPPVVSEQESSFQVPLSEIISVGVNISGADYTVSSLNYKGSIINCPGPFIVVVIKGNFSVLIEANNSQKPVIIVKLPFAVGKSMNCQFITQMLSVLVSLQGSGHC